MEIEVDDGAKGESMKPETMMIDDVKDVRADVSQPAEKLEGMERCIIRSYGAGVFLGYVKEKKAELNGVNIMLCQAKRIHYWDGACSLTQLAMEGTKEADNCRITDGVAGQFIANVIEIIPVTDKAGKNLDEVEIWKK